jgi:hypothetical protein
MTNFFLTSFLVALALVQYLFVVLSIYIYLKRINFGTIILIYFFPLFFLTRKEFVNLILYLACVLLIVCFFDLEPSKVSYCMEGAGAGAVDLDPAVIRILERYRNLVHPLFLYKVWSIESYLKGVISILNHFANDPTIHKIQLYSIRGTLGSLIIPTPQEIDRSLFEILMANWMANPDLHPDPVPSMHAIQTLIYFLEQGIHAQCNDGKQVFIVLNNVGDLYYHADQDWSTKILERLNRNNYHTIYGINPLEVSVFINDDKIYSFNEANLIKLQNEPNFGTGIMSRDLVQKFKISV